MTLPPFDEDDIFDCDDEFLPIAPRHDDELRGAAIMLLIAVAGLLGLALGIVL